MEDSPKPKRTPSIILIAIITAASLCSGLLIGNYIGYRSALEQIEGLRSYLSEIQDQLGYLQTKIDVASENQSNTTQVVKTLESQLIEIKQQLDNLERSNGGSQNENELADIRNQLLSLQQQLTNLKNNLNAAYANITYVLGQNFSLSQLFEQVRESVIVVKALVRETDIFGRPYLVKVQGSGFVSNYTGTMILLTNNHVVAGSININVTFSDGNTYSASIKGTNPNADIAILTTTAPASEYKPLPIVSSATLKVGDPVIVVGTPYGLEGSMNDGIISALNRTITAGQTSITGIIQTTAPLNPGNSGGPLMNYRGQVVGVATAIVEESQGIGLAIPSDTVMQNIMQIMS